MERRDLLPALGAAGALALLPSEAGAAWARVASGLRPLAGLSGAQLALINAIGDTILPRTDSPGAADVNVAAFIDVIVSENYNDADRTAFVAGLDAIEADAKAIGGASFTDLAPTLRGATVVRMESHQDRRAEPQRTYWRLKSLVVHGYFTSEPVMKDVLKVQVMPGAFDGNAPHVVRPTRDDNKSPRSAAENGSNAAAENIV
jgi:hypothetical protein